MGLGAMEAANISVLSTFSFIRVERTHPSTFCGSLFRAGIPGDIRRPADIQAFKQDIVMRGEYGL
jgi:hypothetical protein